MGYARTLLGVVAATAAMVIAAPVLAASSAAADTEIEVEAGYVDGQIVPGRPVPVRVEVRADQLVTGTLTATPYTLGEPGESTGTSVEVAGGSVKDYLLVMPTRWDGTLGPSEVRVTLRTDDGDVEGSTTLSWSGTVEVVGLLPGLVSQVPDPTPLPMGVGRAVFAQLDSQALESPGALGPLGSIVAGPDGLADLPPAARRNVLEWVESGGQLLVDAAPGTPVAGLPQAWQPSGRRAAAGAGWVRLTDGAAARGQWGTIIEPTRQFGAELGIGSVCCPVGVGDAVARDAGLRIPDVGWLLGFLVAYVVIVGPVTFVVVRRLRRTTLAWVAVPLVAVLFTGVAFTAGSSLRGGARAAHGTLVETSALGDHVTSYVGLVSRDGGDPEAFFPEGWDAGGLDPQAMSDGAGVVIEERFGSDFAQFREPVAIEGDDGRPGLRLPLSAGDFGMVTAEGRVDGASPLAVTAVASADGTVAGTVTNDSDLRVEEVIVVVAGQAIGVGDLAPRDRVDWTIDPASVDGPVNDPWSPVEQPWSDALGMDGPPDPDSIVNYSVYATEIGADIDSYPPGVAMAAGWTRDWSPPVDVVGGLAGGRTGIVARAPVEAEPGTVPAAAVRRELVRGPGAVAFDPPIQVLDWGQAMGAIARFTLPDGADPATRLALEASGGVVQAEVWNGRSWEPLVLAGDAGAPAPGGGGGPAPPGAVLPSAPPTVAVGVAGVGDPMGPVRQAALPAGVVRDGCVYVRIAVTPDVGSRMTLQIRGTS